MRRRKKALPKGYDSQLEYDLHQNQLKDWQYHPKERVSYAVPSTYEPDFLSTKGSRYLLVESKGRFRTREEATKYIYIRESLEAEGYQGKEAELIFIFMDSKKPMPFVRKRKDGTRQSHGEWAEKNGFTFYCMKKGLPENIA